MPDLTQLTERGAEAWAGVDAQALRAGREPLTPEQIEEICADLRNTVGCSNTTLARAIETEVRKQDTELIRQMKSALEQMRIWSDSTPMMVIDKVYEPAIAAAKQRLGPA